MKISLLLLIFYLTNLSFAQEVESFINSNIDPLRTFKEVHPEGVIEEVYKIKNAKVLIADYRLIRKDFPEIHNFSDPEIDQWLIDQTGYISKGQQKQKLVNSEIKISSATKRAKRPPEYGRALVFEAKSSNKKKIGLIDVKGSGGINPSFASHNSGTMTLGESLREFSYEKMITSVVDHAAIENKVVGSYAVIYPGFDVLHKDGSSSPAGYYLRQAHRRYTKAEHKLLGSTRGNGWLDDQWRERYKKLMNQYGIFANENYQGTTKNDLFDFGHYIVREDLEIGKKNLMIPFKEWGFDKAANESIAPFIDRWRFSKRDRPWIWSHDTAKAFVEGRASRHDVWMNHYNLLKPVQEKLKDVPRLYKESSKLGFKVKKCNMHLDSRGRIK